MRIIKQIIQSNTPKTGISLIVDGGNLVSGSFKEASSKLGAQVWPEVIAQDYQSWKIYLEVGFVNSIGYNHWSILHTFTGGDVDNNFFQFNVTLGARYRFRLDESDDTQRSNANRNYWVILSN